MRPEIRDLVGLLTSMGADITVRGQERVIIRGVDRLSGAHHIVIPDSMEAMTFAIGAAVTGGQVRIHGFPFTHLEVPLIYLRESGVRLDQDGDTLLVSGGECFPIEISTGPFPGINSDMQPLFAVFALKAHGVSKITDLRFPDRFAYAQELRKFGADIEVRQNTLLIRGKGGGLRGARVTALDLRCGAALALAGLIADGTTVIERAEEICRGYEDLPGKTALLGGFLESAGPVPAV